LSDILRLVAGGLIAIACTYIGLVIKRRYKARAEFFCEAKEYFVFFERELVYNKTPVPKINDEFSRDRSGEFVKFLLQSRSGETEKREPYFLKKEETNRLKTALSGLGKSGYEEQQKYVARWKSEMTELSDKAAADNKKYGGMYFKLCVLLGIAVVILLA